MGEVVSETGRVVKIENSLAEIQLIRSENCNDCSAKIICHSDASAKLQRLKLKIPSDIQLNDLVKITFCGDQLLSVVILLYGVPILFLILTISLVMNYSAELRFKEVIATSISVIILIIYYLFVHKFSKKYFSMAENKIRIEKLN